MQFDHSHKPNREKISPATAATMDKIFYQRRDAGLNVQWINNGNLDEWSLLNAEMRDKFTAHLTRLNIDFALVQS